MLGILTGLRSEAALLAATVSRASAVEEPPRIVCSAGNAQRAHQGAQRLLADGAKALLSFGLAGGLDPSLASGALVLAEGVCTATAGRLACDERWHGALLTRLRHGCEPVIADLAGRDEVAAAVRAKEALHRASGAVAVDTESHAVATVAAAAGVPFLVLRAIADPAWRAIPSCALVGLNDDGRMNALPVFLRLLVKPWELPALLLLARDYAAGMAALRRVTRLAAPRFGLG